ncbi:hypothetical protein DBR06_SOUSAS3310125, partial [Sousa chinensis]
QTSAHREDAFHFVRCVPVGGRLCELGRLRERLIDLGGYNQDNWIA